MDYKLWTTNYELSAMSHELIRVFAFSREAGGAEAIVPVIEVGIKNGMDFLVCGKDYSLGVYDRYHLKAFELMDADERCLNKLFDSFWDGKRPDVFLSSAASLPELDMTEKLLWRRAEQSATPSLAVLDQWQNYALRFSGAGAMESLRYLPTLCCVMDQRAFIEMAEEGFPEDRMVITGQPAFDKLIEFAKGFNNDRKEEVLTKIGIDNGRPVVMFVAEAFHRHFGDALGYDEKTILKVIVDTLIKHPSRPNLIIKKHPQNNDNDFNGTGLETARDKISLSIIGSHIPSPTLLMLSDLVIGMSSILLVESIILNRLTVSLQVGANPIAADQCYPVKIGAIPFINNYNEAVKTITNLLDNQTTRKQWIERQKKISHNLGSAERVYNELIKLAHSSG